MECADCGKQIDPEKPVPHRLSKVYGEDVCIYCIHEMEQDNPEHPAEGEFSEWVEEQHDLYDDMIEIIQFN